MDISSIKRIITETFQDSYYKELDGDVFFFYGKDDRFPFATIVTKDNGFDNASKLDRPDIFRLNIGVGKETFKFLFGDVKSKSGLGGYLESGLDFTTTDKLMPHPMYGNQYWVCLLNPGEETFKNILPYLSEAYEKAVKKENK
jgi:hypothetical protein